MGRVVPDAAIGDEDLERWFLQWQNEGRSKNDIERNELQDPFSHGKRISRLWRERLNWETEDEHRLVTENRRLRKLLTEHGIPIPPGEE